jgi:hypothetical protein
MSTVSNHFDDLHFTESKIAGFEFNVNELSLTVYIDSGLEVYKPHPLSETTSFTDSCKIIFKGVKSWKKSFDKYDKNTKSYVETLEDIENFEIDKPNSIYQTYSIEGFLLKPEGWLTWDVEAEEFYLDDLKG